ncbi:hypothetical protein [Kordiimonas sp.]|uniref:hypothetical protein n=1 Tax=Kordiimonas sp. TaxID=1970157 RepID=UPI003A937836
MKADGFGKVFLFAVTFFAAAVVVAGIMLIRSPGEMKLVKLDARRVNDLRQLSRMINAHHKDGGVLPASLAELSTAGRPRALLTDPVTGEAYAYQVASPLSYKLCAVFALSDHDEDPSELYGYSVGAPTDWRHDAGPYCYELTVKNRDAE